MRITILTGSFYPDPIGIAPLMAELTEDLVQAGHDVNIATVFPHYPEWAIHPEYRGRMWARETWQGAKVLRTYVRVSKKGTVASKMMYYSSFTATSLVGSLSWGPQDILLVVSPPLSLSLTSSFVRLFRNTPAVLLVCDLLPDTAIALGMIKNRHFIRSLYAFERWSYRRFDHIVVVSNAFRSKLLQKGVPDERISVIHTWVDTKFIRPLDREGLFREKHGLKGKFLVLYAGNIGLSQGLETALHAARKLQEVEDVQFVIVGDGTGGDRLKQTAGEMKLPNVRFLPLQPRAEIPWMYAAADVSLVMQRQNVLDINLPGKIQTIMSSGRPLVAATHPAGEVAKIIREAGSGMLVAPENAEQLADAIRTLHRDETARQRMGAAGRDYALRRFSRQAAVQAHLQVLERASNKGTAVQTSQRPLAAPEPVEAAYFPDSREDNR